MARYVATIRIQVEYDADTSHEAEMIARKLADAASVPAPTGRNAEFLSASVRIRPVVAHTPRSR